MSDDNAWADTSDDEFDPRTSTRSKPGLPQLVTTSPSSTLSHLPTTRRTARQASYSLWDLLPGSGSKKDRESPVSNEGELPVITPTSSTSSASNPIPIRGRSSVDSGKATAISGSSGGSSSWIHVDESAPSGKASRRRRETSPLTKDAMQKAVRPAVDDLMKNPALALSKLKITDDGHFAKEQEEALKNGLANDTTPTSSIIANGSAESAASPGREAQRKAKFLRCLREENIDISQLKALAWSGIPAELRPLTWQILLNYVPTNASRRIAVLARKRQEYADAVKLAFAKGKSGLDQATWHQIYIDVPRTNPGVRLWQFEATQRSLERILYVWAIRHPASGYVQGINDIVTPFFQVFLASYIDVNPEEFDVALLPPSVLEALEADSFWCLSKLLDGIQDNYIYAQPGIQRQVARMKELCARVDAPLAAHLEEQNVEFIQFAWRWQNCLLLREVPITAVVRMWDTYFAEGTDKFAEFHLFVCLAFLVKWSDKLRSMDFQGIIMFLQSLPSTQTWDEDATVMLLSESEVTASEVIWAPEPSEAV